MADYYATEGIVLGSWDRGEADRLFVLYTKELGMMRALAKGVRLEKSKLRPQLQIFSFGAFRLVNGRELFRLIDANAHARLRPTEGAMARFETFGFIASFLLRMVRGDEADVAVWDLLRHAFIFLHTATGEQSLDALQTLFCARLLYHLGYVSLHEARPELSKLLTISEFAPEILAAATKQQPLLEQMIESGVHASQM